MIRPIQDRVIVKQDPPKAMSAGGLHLPDRVEVRENFGRVVAVGPGLTGPLGQRMSLAVKVGDRVLFTRRPGSAINPDVREGRTEFDDLLVLREEDIIAIVED